MNFPKKISPDRIRDSIVEVKYASSIPFQVLIGFFYNSLDDTYIYTNQPISSSQINPQISLSNEIAIFGGQNFFFTDKIKIQLQPNSLIFNCINEYIGWDEYRLEIEKTLKQFFTLKDIEKYTRIGVRYVSEYPEMDIKNCVKFDFTFGLSEVKSDTYLFRSEFIWDEHRVILNLQHKAPVLKTKVDKNKAEITSVPVSIIDIDVIADKLEINNLEKLMEYIDKVHQNEKEIFFKILKDDFLKSLKLEY